MKQVQIEKLWFRFEDTGPTLPLRGIGSINHIGWDIPTHWAVDADGQAWMDNGHGGDLEREKPQYLLDLAVREKNDEQAQFIAIALELPVPDPSWAEAAKRRGWMPPQKTAYLSNANSVGGYSGYGPRIFLAYADISTDARDILNTYDRWNGPDKDTGKAKGWEFGSAEAYAQAVLQLAQKGYAVVAVSEQNRDKVW
ncbi:hypothetical protein [Myxococcus phage Mx1]|nr:hypothetical protein [Myxococcus phage Mx1]